MSAMFLFQFAIVLLCILVGARVGGIGLGVCSKSLPIFYVAIPNTSLLWLRQ